MEQNVGSADRILRVLLGLALLPMLLWVEGPLGWLGLIGLVPLGTAIVGWCPLYRLFGASTCSRRQEA